MTASGCRWRTPTQYSKRVQFKQENSDAQAHRAKDSMQVFVKVSVNNTVVAHVAPQDNTINLKAQTANTSFGVHVHDIILTFAGKQLEDSRRVADYGMPRHATVFVASRLRGGSLDSDEVRKASQRMEAQVQHVPLTEQSNSEELRNMRERKCMHGYEYGGIAGAIRKGRPKAISPRKFSNPQSSGSFQVWARSVKDFL